jgi:hypothetical protein
LLLASACAPNDPPSNPQTGEGLQTDSVDVGGRTDNGDASTESEDSDSLSAGGSIDETFDSCLDTMEAIEEPPLPPPLSHFYKLQAQAMDARRKTCGLPGLPAVVVPEGLVEHLTTRDEYARHEACLRGLAGLPCASTVLVKGELEDLENCLYHEPQSFDALNPPAQCLFLLDEFTYDVRRERFSLNNAYFLLEFSILSKLETSAKAMAALEPLGYLDVSIINMRRVVLLYAEHEDHVVLAFKGSTNVSDYFSNATYGMVDKAKSGLPGKVHEGFSNTLNGDWSALAKIIGQAFATGKPVVFTGHSLGGALAQLSALRIYLTKGLVVHSLYMFSVPRVGNEAYASAYTELLGDVSFRVNNGMDITPHVPPAAGAEEAAKEAVVSVLAGGGFGSGALAGLLEMVLLPSDYTQVGDELWIDPQGYLFGVLDDDVASDTAYWSALEQLFDDWSVTEIIEAFSQFHDDATHLCYQGRFVEQLLYPRD